MEMYVFNVKLIQNNNDLLPGKEKSYIDLIERVFEKNENKKLRGVNNAFFKEKFWDENHRIFKGKLMRYTHINEDGFWVNTKKKDFVPSPELDKNTHPNASEFSYVFFPMSHRFFIDVKFGNTKSVSTFLKTTFKNILHRDDDIIVSTEASSYDIYKITNSKNLKKIKLTFSYTNSDVIGEEFAILFDNLCKNTEAHSSVIEIKARRGKNQVLSPLSYTSTGKGLARLVQKNGSIYAVSSNNEIFSTDDNPRKITQLSETLDWADIDRLRRSIDDYDGEEDMNPQRD